jgi:hypothetical protein
MGFKPRKKIKANFISKKNQASSAGMGQKTPEPYGKPVEAVGVFSQNQSQFVGLRW